MRGAARSGAPQTRDLAASGRIPEQRRTTGVLRHIWNDGFIGQTAGMRPLKRSFTIAGHSTSISLEAPFWEALKDAAQERGQSVAGLVEEIDTQRGTAGLSSAVRVWVLGYYRGTRRKSDGSLQVPERSTDS